MHVSNHYFYSSAHPVDGVGDIMFLGCLFVCVYTCIDVCLEPQLEAFSDRLAVDF